MRCMGSESQTLIHTDAHQGQMCFPTEQFPRFVLFDWQYPSKGWAAQDVVHLIVSSLDYDVRREHEEALIDHYLACLSQHGAHDLTRERFWFHCRLSLLWYCFMEFNVVANPDLLKSLQEEAAAEGEEWREWLFSGIDAAICDWRLGDAIEQAVEEGCA